MFNPKRVQEIQNAIYALPADSAAFAGIVEWVANMAEEANVIGTSNQIDPQERAWWCGAERVLRDLMSDLREMRAGKFISSARRTHRRGEEDDEE